MMTGEQKLTVIASRSATIKKAQETGLSPLFQLCEKYFGRIHVAAIIDGTDMTYTGELPRKTKRVPALEQSNPEGLPNDQSYRGRAPAD
ncbi:hypothetical protein [Plesiomonas shigelloides]|uniref:hypothetical protein n=1 Tax=Plesiomonas shigelloides TaxID=703 RepID=UPI0014835457|nr:hypothetical protein [Plesiomonas shigelloides]